MQSNGFKWLIEAPGQYYLAARMLGNSHEFHWTRDHNKALWFASYNQAEPTMMAIRQLCPALFEFAKQLHDARPVEHQWMDNHA